MTHTLKKHQSTEEQQTVQHSEQIYYNEGR